jgi:hypothetical protein
VGVPAQARLLVVGVDPSPNISLTHMERSGLIVCDSASRIDAGSMLRLMASHQLSYLVMPDKYYRQIQALNPTFLAPFRPLSNEPRRVVLVPTKPLPNW